MKKYLLSLLTMVVASGLSFGQSFYVCSEGNVETVSELSFTNNGTTLNGSMSTAAVDSITLHVPALRFVGGDLSLLPSYEQHGAKYMDVDGQPINGLLPYLKQQGWNAVRVRLFVDPSLASSADKGQGVCQDLDYVKAFGKQVKEAGMLLMLDFHYSDSWADPAKQWIPASWVSFSEEELKTKIYDYTKDCLEQMNVAGASPDFIQTGNEISYGLLWGKEGTKTWFCNSGASDNVWNRFTTLLKQAGKACREVCPRAKIVLHTERVSNTGVLTNFYNKMRQAGVDYDIIGLSYYSYYHGDLNALGSALSLLENQFANKQIMIVEAGYYHAWQPTGSDIKDISSVYPINAEGQKAFTNDLIAVLKSHKNVTGLFWWWPEANEYGLNWNTQRVTNEWYNAGLFDNQTGRAMPALYELKNFR